MLGSLFSTTDRIDDDCEGRGDRLAATSLNPLTLSYPFLLDTLYSRFTPICTSFSLVPSIALTWYDTFHTTSQLSGTENPLLSFEISIDKSTREEKKDTERI